MEDLNDKITGGNLSATEWNQVPSEIQNIIEAFGIALSSGDLNQLGKGVAGYVANGNFYTDGGAADAYVLTKIGTKQQATAYTDGFRVSFIPDNTNTGASTVNTGGLGVKNLKDIVGNDLIAGAITATEIVVAYYDLGSDEFRLLPQLTQANKIELKSGRKNVLFGNFRVNQRAVSGTVILLAGEYGHDRFKAGSGGCTYTFATALGVTTITISAGTLEQEIEGDNLESADYVLSWVGTSQGQIDGGGFGDTGLVTDTLVGGTNATVEFDAGTLALPQLEASSFATDFEDRPISEELDLCKFYTRWETVSWHGQTAALGSDYGNGASFDMRGVPTVAQVVDISVDGFGAGLVADAFNLTKLGARVKRTPTIVANGKHFSTQYLFTAEL